MPSFSLTHCLRNVTQTDASWDLRSNFMFMCTFVQRAAVHRWGGYSNIRLNCSVSDTYALRANTDCFGGARTHCINPATTSIAFSRGDMGLLTKGDRLLTWQETKELAGTVRRIGVRQFIAVYLRFKDWKGDPFKWGDEVRAWRCLGDNQTGFSMP